MNKKNEKRLGVENLMPISKEIAERYGCDLAVPNCRRAGFGNILIYTSLVEGMALSLGRRISIVAGGIDPIGGVVENEDPFAFWRCNPYIERIVDIAELPDADIEQYLSINKERKFLIQINHVIENLCFAFGVKPRTLRPSLFLSSKEMAHAIDTLSELHRPVVCVHPGGKTSSLRPSPWYLEKWISLTEEISGEAGVFQVGRQEFGDRDLGLRHFRTTYRELMALIWASDIFLGFNSGPAHIAAAFEKPSIVLFDMERLHSSEARKSQYHSPSIILRWAYPKNYNFCIMPNDDHDALSMRVRDAIKTEIRKLNYLS